MTNLEFQIIDFFLYFQNLMGSRTLLIRLTGSIEPIELMLTEPLKIIMKKSQKPIDVNTKFADIFFKRLQILNYIPISTCEVHLQTHYIRMTQKLIWVLCYSLTLLSS